MNHYMSCYGIIGAMDTEIRMIRERMDRCRTNSLYGLTFYQGRIGTHDVVLAKCGVGKVNAARCTDLVQHDFRMAALGCVDGCLTLEGPKDEPTLFHADEGLLIRFEKVAQETAGEAAIHRGRIASGDTFVADKASKEKIYESFGALACEMEGAAIAQVAQAAQVPFLVVRAISDLADGSASESFAAFERHAASMSASMLLKFLENV